MNTQELIDFKNLIIFKEIHKVERSDDFYNFIESADLLMNISSRHTDKKYAVDIWRNCKNSFEFSNPTVDDLFKYIASRIIYHEKLVQVIKDFHKNSIETTYISAHNSPNEYYLGIFNNRISEGKKTLHKLRPYILEYTKNWSLERKQEDLNRDIGKFYKNWYIREKEDKNLSEA